MCILVITLMSSFTMFDNEKHKIYDQVCQGKKNKKVLQPKCPQRVAGVRDNVVVLVNVQAGNDGHQEKHAPIELVDPHLSVRLDYHHYHCHDDAEDGLYCALYGKVPR